VRFEKWKRRNEYEWGERGSVEVGGGGWENLAFFWVNGWNERRKKEKEEETMG